MKIVENNKIICDSKDLMKIFKERQLAVKISNEDEYDIFIEMAEEAGFDIPEGLCFEDIKKRPCLHLSQVFENKLFCDFVEYCKAPENPYAWRNIDMRPYKVVSYDEFIHMACKPADKKLFSLSCDKPFEFTLTKIEKPLERELEAVNPDKVSAITMAPLNNAFEMMRKGVHQSLVDGVMNQPYDIHISSDGKTTTANFYVNGKVVREAEAKCHPEDRFNFRTGAELAFDRLWEKKPKEKKIEEEMPKADLKNLKVGDKVRVRDDLVSGEFYNGFCFSHNLEKFRGKEVTIRRVSTFKPTRPPADETVIYLIKEDDHGWVFTPPMLEEI